LRCWPGGNVCRHCAVWREGSGRFAMARRRTITGDILSVLDAAQFQRCFVD
jgi:hypothetical protein